MTRTTVRHTARAVGKAFGLGSAGILVASGVLVVGAGPAHAAPLPPNCGADAAVVTCFFSYDGTDGSDGSVQHFVVPAGVTQVTIEAWGAQGGDAGGGQALGGPGGYSGGTVAVVPHATLDVTVGGQPTGTTGGYNGGGATGAPQSAYATGAGGGATDVRLGGHTLAHRIVVAGGGGGGAYDSYLGGLGGPYSASDQSQGGAGGGSSGTESAFCALNGPWPSCGGAGSSSAGGAAGPSMSPCTTPGTLGIGGSGCGGGGGGGLYGGGGGGYFDGTLGCCTYIGPVPVDSPGGGGSGYVTPAATGAMSRSGLQFGNGAVRISYVTKRASRGLTWTSPLTIDSTGGALSGISCPTTTFCMAVDSAGNAAIDRAGTWSAFVPVAGPGDDFTGVSCSSARFCVAVGTAPANAHFDEDLAVIYRDGVWSSNTSVSVAPGETLAAVSCARDTEDCTAVGWISEGPGDAMVGETYNGHAWTASAGGSGYGSVGDRLTSVSCTSGSSCLAGGVVQDRNDMGDWMSVGGQITNDQIMGITGQVNAVSCAAATACVGAGNGGYVFSLAGGTWSAPADVDVSSTITALSCTDTATCLAVDTGGDALVSRSGRWSTALPIDPGRDLSAVSCPKAAFCVAVDTAGNVVVGS